MRLGRLPALTSTGHTPKPLLAVMLVGLASLCGLGTWTIVDSYREAWHQAAVATDNIALLLERDISHSVDAFDYAFETVADNLLDSSILSAAPALRRKLLFFHAASTRNDMELLVVDAAGAITASATTEAALHGSVAGRDYFDTLRRAPAGSHDLFVGRPFRVLDGEGWIIPLARRLNATDGGFAGIVLGLWPVADIEAYFHQVSVGDDGVIYLTREDGVLMARTPRQDRLMGETVVGSNLVKAARGTTAGGRFVQPSVVDGIDRLTAFHRVGTSSLLIGAGMSVDAFLASWWRKAVATAGAITLMVIGVLVLAVRFGRELNRRSEAERALAALATTDDLTGLPNRRKFESDFDREWRCAERDGSLFSLLLIDVDFFKRYNDTYGHQDGDIVLRDVATALVGVLGRPGECAARYGGEEFAVLLPQTAPAAAHDMAQRIRRAVLSLACEHTASPFGVLTVSIGVASIKPRYVDHPSTLVRAADIALYSAKSRGRNTIAAANADDLAQAS